MIPILLGKAWSINWKRPTDSKGWRAEQQCIQDTYVGYLIFLFSKKKLPTWFSCFCADVRLWPHDSPCTKPSENGEGRTL